jgi:hypothetical protein
VRCWWNQVATWVSGPANGFTIAMAAEVGGRLNEGITKKAKQGIHHLGLVKF